MKMIESLRRFWEFTRPHTLIGTVVSIVALYFMARPFDGMPYWELWLPLLAAIASNIFITGYNQFVDVELDRINKPWLPLASGEMDRSLAGIIIVIALISSLLSSWFAGIDLFYLILLILFIGFVYSWKNVYLKKHHRTAAIAIILVRGVLVNLGFYLHFSVKSWTPDSIPIEIWLLTFFVSVFSLAIAWFKDIPDLRGDQTKSILTMALKIGPQKIYERGLILIYFAYFTVSIIPIFVQIPDFKGGTLSLVNGIIGIIFIWRSRAVNPLEADEIKKFYRDFWGFFVLEYVVFALCSLQ